MASRTGLGLPTRSPFDPWDLFLSWYALLLLGNENLFKILIF